MTQPDRPQYPDPTDPNRPDQEDPEVTQVVRRDLLGPSGGDDRADGDGTPSTGGDDRANGGDTPSTGGDDRADGGDGPSAAGDVPSGISESATGAGTEFGGQQPPDDEGSPDSFGPGSPGTAGSAGPEYPPGPPSGPWPRTDTGPTTDAGPTTAMPPYGGPGPQSPAYGGAPTQYLAPDSPAGAPPAGPPPGDYSYQQTAAYPPSGEPAGYGTGPAPVAPQVIAPPSASVVLPPVRMPKAESRVALNVLGSIVGLILVAGGLVLVLLFQGKMRTVDTSEAGSLTDGGAAALAGGGLDVLAVVLTIVGAILIALAALLAAWASWSPIVPGVLLAAASVWAMVTTGPGSGGARIADGTSWAFDNGQFALFCMSGWGLGVGLVLFVCGLAAVFLRAGVRRTIRQQLESIQS